MARKVRRQGKKEQAVYLFYRLRVRRHPFALALAIFELLVVRNGGLMSGGLGKMAGRAQGAGSRLPRRHGTFPSRDMWSKLSPDFTNFGR